jgi:ABC-2 type transport system permease protein
VRRVLAQTRKELTQVVRDRLSVALILVLPLLLLLLIGSAISLDVTDMPIVAQDLDDSPASREFLDAFRASLGFRVVPWKSDENPTNALRDGVARGALIIPRHFSRTLARGGTAEVQLLIDATDANTAKLVQGYAGQVARAYQQHSGMSTRPTLVQAQIRLWYNPGRVSKKFFGPGIFVLGLSMFPPLLAALAMAKEGEEKTILQVYVSNISAHEFLLGKIFSCMVLALAEWMLSLAFLLTYFGLNFVGDPSAFLVASVLYIFCVSAYGTLIGAAIPNQAAAMQAVALGGFLLVFLLSGLIFPVSNIPPGLRWVSNLVWGRYYIEIVRDALLVGGGWAAMWRNVTAIAAIGGVFYVLAWRSMRRMQLGV